MKKFRDNFKETSVLGYYNYLLKNLFKTISKKKIFLELFKIWTNDLNEKFY